MARKQTRRTVSLNRSTFEAAKREAASRNITLSALVEEGLAAVGVAVAQHPQQPVALAQANAEARAKSIAKKPKSRERQILGDEVADRLGFA